MNPVAKLLTDRREFVEIRLSQLKEDQEKYTEWAVQARKESDALTKELAELEHFLLVAIPNT